MRRFLTFVVEEALDGRPGQLCEYSIGISVFDCDESFEPSVDPVVRNEARRLRQKLLEYYRQSSCCSSDQDEVVIEIPKGSYVPTFNLASHRQELQAFPQYRLTVSLIRIADDAKIWCSQHEY